MIGCYIKILLYGKSKEEASNGNDKNRTRNNDYFGYDFPFLLDLQCTACDQFKDGEDRDAKPKAHGAAKVIQQGDWSQFLHTSGDSNFRVEVESYIFSAVEVVFFRVSSFCFDVQGGAGIGTEGEKAVNQRFWGQQRYRNKF